MYYELNDAFIVPATIERVWEFFSTADNLPDITPAWLNFRMAMREPVKIELDARLDYTIRWMGIPVRWRTRIIDWTPMSQFIDLQTRGPYTLWHHLHRFEPTQEGVRCFDRVIYKLPMGWAGGVTHGLIVKRQLMEIFRHRRRVIGERLGGFTSIQKDVTIERMK